MATESLAPVLLVSMPQMLDPNFHKSVVLLAEYGAGGAFGLVVNRQMDEPARSVVTSDKPLNVHPNLHLFTGGPVEPTRAWVLTANRDLAGDALEVADGVLLVSVGGAGAPDTGTTPRPSRQDGGGLRRLGRRATRRGVGRVGLADGAGAARPDFRGSDRPDVGDGDPQAGS